MEKNIDIEKIIIYGILSPTIVDRRWMEVPEDLLVLARIYRIGFAPIVLQEEMSTEFDAFVYLYTASFAVPFDATWYNIYFYLFTKFFPKHAKTLNIKVKKLQPHEELSLNNLRRWIFKNQMKIVKERMKKAGLKLRRNNKTTNVCHLQKIIKARIGEHI
ncbi:MAG: hypothetical protein B6U95_00260 [Thermofilum sp. ex4484_82]|nr:MAG: hypothetical protein B6U95_00260 [Thermofilum sp. ex4484_82]OYT40163.1 MAG: hypothetical protein B6U96_00260 [Archaeoglobales archaeon ex4484_92]